MPRQLGLLLRGSALKLPVTIEPSKAPLMPGVRLAYKETIVSERKPPPSGYAAVALCKLLVKKGGVGFALVDGLPPPMPTPWLKAGQTLGFPWPSDVPTDAVVVSVGSRWDFSEWRKRGREAGVPSPKPGEILVKPHACWTAGIYDPDEK